MFSWLPLLAAGLGIVGNIMGNSTTTNTTQATNTSSSASGAQSSVTAGGQQTGTTTNQTSTGTTNENVAQTGTSTTQQATTEQGTGQLSRLDDNTLALLTQRVREQVANGSRTQDALNQELESIRGSDANFDADSFVQGIMRQTADQVGYDLESESNVGASRGGVSARGSSAQALLEGRLKGSAAATMAGAKSQAVATAQDILTKTAESKTARMGAVTAQLDSGTNSMLNSLLQATQKESTATTGSASGSGTNTANTQTGTSATQQTNQTANQKTAQTGTQETRSSENSNSSSNVQQSQLENKVDWTKVFSGIGSIFTTQF